MFFVLFANVDWIGLLFMFFDLFFINVSKVLLYYFKYVIIICIYLLYIFIKLKYFFIVIRIKLF